MLDLGKLSPADDHCIGEGINDFGHVVGWSRDFAYGGLGDRAFVWTAEHGMCDIGSLGGGEANAYAINNAGAIVGASNTIATSDNWKRDAFIWQDGVMRDLNDLIGFELGYRLTGAFGINDLGQIVAFSDPSYIPEPATVLLFGLGGLGLLRSRRLGCAEDCGA